MCPMHALHRLDVHGCGKESRCKCGEVRRFGKGIVRMRACSVGAESRLQGLRGCFCFRIREKVHFVCGEVLRFVIEARVS